MPRVSRFTPLAEIPAVVLDTETTGLDVTRCRVVQISAVRVAGGQLLDDQPFDRLVNPREPIPPRATLIHGITDAMVDGAPTFAELKPEIDRFIDGAVIVGQSIGFDLAVLLRETERIGATWRRPQFLDTKLLAAALDPEAAELGLDALAARLGVPIADRHQALGDALVTAEIFARLLPRLAEAGIRTLGDAEARTNALVRIRDRQAAAGWYDATSVRPPDAFESGRDAPALARLDRFAYRYRVDQVMGRVPELLSPTATVSTGVARMAELNLEVLLTGDPASGRVDGIVTPRDLVRAIARDGAATLTHKLETVMSAPVATMPRDALLYRALARMQRLGIGQLPIEDTSRRVIGMLSLRDLLPDEAGGAALIGDRLSSAATPQALAKARADLPALARQLLGDGVSAAEVAAVLAAELRELLARAAVLAEKRMETEGAGRPPVPYALLALGRAGRGESSLLAEVTPALVFASGATDGFEARWFATFDDHLCDVLRAAGVAAEPDSAAAAERRRSLEGWRAALESWAAQPATAAPAAQLFDFRLVYGDEDLGEDLRTQAVEIAAKAPALARALGPTPGAAAGGAGIDLATAGLGPIEALARALTVATRGRALATEERLTQACPLTGLPRSTADELSESHDRLLALLLDHQTTALAAGNPASTVVDPAVLDQATRAEVEAIVARVARLHDIMRVAVALI